MSAVNYIPAGYHTATPYLAVSDTAKANEFYKLAFGAKEVVHLETPDGEIMHAEIQIGDSRIMLSGEMSDSNWRSPSSLRGNSVGICLYFEDVDAAFEQALDAGAQELMPVADMFWGDRMGQLSDPQGHRWMLASHKEDLSPEQVQQRANEFFASQSKP